MKELVILIMGLIAMFSAIDKAAQFGSTWELQTNPIENVEVELINGKIITGTLSRDWDNNWNVKTTQKETHIFSDFKMMSVKPVTQSQAPHTSIIRPVRLSSWRYLTPMAAIFLLYMMFVVVVIQMAKHSSQSID